MNGNGLFTLDTNILFYASDENVPEKRDRAQLLIRIAAEQDCMLPLQCLAELYNALSKRRTLVPKAAERIVLAYRETLRIVAATDADLVDAMLAHQQHNLSFWDAMLWATARRAGCTLVLTEDLQDGRVLGGVAFRDPFKLSARELRGLLS